jgi:hypothetical protein
MFGLALKVLIRGYDNRPYKNAFHNAPKIEIWSRFQICILIQFNFKILLSNDFHSNLYGNY